MDTSAAGKGKLHFEVRCQGHEVPIRLHEVARDRFDVSFIPKNIETHSVRVFFNGYLVPGNYLISRFKLQWN